MTSLWTQKPSGERNTMIPQKEHRGLLPPTASTHAGQSHCEKNIGNSHERTI